MLEIINKKFDIWDISELRTNVRNNAPIPPGIHHDPTVCIRGGINITDSVGEILWNDKIKKELKSFLYDRG